MDDYDEDFPQFVGTLAEFDEVQVATPDRDGLISAPFIPLRDMVIFPNMVTPLFVGRPRSLEALQAAQRDGVTLICATQKDSDVDEPERGNIFDVGIELVVGRALRMPDGTTNALVQGRRRVEVVDIVQRDPYYVIKARPIVESTAHSNEIEARMRAVLTLFEKCVELNRSLPEDAYIYAMNIDEPGWLADLVATALDLSTRSGRSCWRSATLPNG